MISACVLVTALAGCTTRQPISRLPLGEVHPQVGYVDVALVEGSDPRMPLLKGLDMALLASNRRAVINKTQPLNLGVVSLMTTVSDLGDVNLNAGLEEAQHKQLDEITHKVLSLLDDRLSSAEKLKLSALAAEKASAGNSELSVLSAQLDDLANKEAATYVADAEKIASLKLQISAMKLNATPPPTAPKGYWATVQSSKEEELAQLLTQYDAQLKSIFDSRDQKVASEQLKIHTEFINEMNSLKSTADQNRISSLKAAQERFNKEKAELDIEDHTAILEAQNVIAGQSNSSGSGMLQVSKFSSQLLPSDIGPLIQYRTALAKKIRIDTLSSINLISKNRNIDLVDRQAGVKDLTPLFVEAVKDQNWKVS